MSESVIVLIIFFIEKLVNFYKRCPTVIKN